MPDFRDLDPEIRCFALVGRFLQAWSLMETSLHAAIGAALSIEITKLQILCANMRFREKLHTLATLIDVAPNFASDEKAEFRKKLNALGDYSVNRNTMVHNPFGPDTSKEGVEFLTVKAKGKFALPNIVWNVDRFQTEGATIEQYRGLLAGLTARFHAQPLTPQSYSAALRPFLYDDDEDYWTLPPTMRMTPPVLLDHLSRQPQSPPDADQANPGRDAQTPDKPEG